MTTYNLFDTVQTTEIIRLNNQKTIPVNTSGAIVEIYNHGEAYEVELFGNWVTYDSQGDFIASHRDDPNAFIETLAVLTLRPHQLQLVSPASQTVGIRAQLFGVLDELSEDKLTQVKAFAESLR